MDFVYVNGDRYAEFAGLRAQPGLVHAFSTRPLDVSRCEDEPDSERAAQCALRRVKMARDFGFAPEYLCCCIQVHEARVAVVEDDDAGRRLEACDAAVTAVPGVALMTFSADCPLVLVYDRDRHVVGVAHASWRSACAEISWRLVETMVNRFSSDPGGLWAGIGPSAGPQNYEVRSDVYDAAVALPDRDRLFQARDGRMYFDLWQASRVQLERAGLRRGNIEVAGICTMDRTDLFYSYRREGPQCGHFALLAGLDVR